MLKKQGEKETSGKDYRTGNFSRGTNMAYAKTVFWIKFFERDLNIAQISAHSKQQLNNTRNRVPVFSQKSSIFILLLVLY